MKKNTSLSIKNLLQQHENIPSFTHNLKLFPRKHQTPIKHPNINIY